jgi:hypothetical protein
MVLPVLNNTLVDFRFDKHLDLPIPQLQRAGNEARHKMTEDFI